MKGEKIKPLMADKEGFSRAVHQIFEEHSQNGKVPHSDFWTAFDRVAGIAGLPPLGANEKVRSARSLVILTVSILVMQGSRVAVKEAVKVWESHTPSVVLWTLTSLGSAEREAPPVFSRGFLFLRGVFLHNRRDDKTCAADILSLFV